MIIRKANPEDTQQAGYALEKVKMQMQSEGIDQWDETYPNEFVLAKDIEKEEAFVLIENDKVLAFMTLNESYDKEYDDLNWQTTTPFLIMHRLFVKPSAQGRGISSKMIAYAEKYACEHNYKSIRFDTFSLNDTANAVYTKKGYKLIGTVQFRKGVFNCYEKSLQ